MNKDTIIEGIVSIMVAGLIFGTIFIGAIATIDGENSTTYTNEVVYSGAYTVPASYTLDGKDNYKLESAPAYSAFKINGEYVNIQRWDYVQQKVITDLCRIETAGHTMQVWDATGSRIVNTSTSTHNVVVDYVADTKLLTITVYTDLTNTEIDTQLTYTVSQILYADPHGTYGAINTGGDPDVSYYVNDLSQVVAGGAYLTGELDTGYFAEGTTVYTSEAGYTGTATANTEKVINEVIAGSSFAVSITDGETTETFTPFVVYVPITIKGYTDSQSQINDILGLLPLVIGVGILLWAVYYFIRRY